MFFRALYFAFRAPLTLLNDRAAAVLLCALQENFKITRTLVSRSPDQLIVAR